MGRGVGLACTSRFIGWMTVCIVLGGCAPKASGVADDSTAADSSDGATGTQGSESGSAQGATGDPCAPWDLPGDIAVLERTGAGQFEAHSLATWTGNAPWPLVGDYDGNGELDLFIYGFGVSAAMMLSGIDDAPVAVEGVGTDIQIAGVGDVDGDGADDIVANVVYDGYGLIRVGPDGPEVTTDIPESLYPLAVAGDLDADGQVDLVGGDGWHGYRVHWGNGTLQPEPGPSVALPADACEWEAKAELVVPREGRTPALVVATGVNGGDDCEKGVFIAIPDGREVPPTLEMLESAPYLTTAAAVDWNGDGHVDIAYGTRDGEVRVALADGEGGFAPFVEELRLDGYMQAVARDPNGRLQLAVRQGFLCVDDEGYEVTEDWLSLMVRPPGGEFGDYESIGPRCMEGLFVSFTTGLLGSPPGMLLNRIEPVGE